MPQASYSVTINRRVADVFEFVSDGEQARRWRPGVLDIDPYVPGKSSARFIGAALPSSFLSSIFASAIAGSSAEESGADQTTTETSVSFCLPSCR